MSAHIGKQYYIEAAFGKYLEDDTVTEICINRPNEVWLLKRNEWVYEETDFDLKKSFSLASALANLKNDKIDESKPILSGTLVTGERVQVVIPPACTRDTVSFTIRKPSRRHFSMVDYEKSGYFEKVRKYGDLIEDPVLAVYKSGDYAEFLKQAVIYEKNIVVAGETNSGKTTLMKALIDFIPVDERLITIEDTNEIVFKQHKNFVQLFYPSEAKTSDILTASSLLKSCLRMNPDRILLAELRSGETFDFINVLSSGHGGSITSCHAGSVEQTFDRLGLMTMQNEQGVHLPYQVIQQLLRQTIDVVLHVGFEKGDRFLSEVYYKGAYFERGMKC